MNTSAEKTATGTLLKIRKIGKYLGLTVAAVIGVVIIMSVLNVAIPVNFLKDTIQETVRAATNRNIQIDGDIGLVPGLSPAFVIEQVTLDNPDSFEQENFISIAEISAQIHLVPLLSKEIHIGKVLVDQVSLNLIQPDEEDPNWVFDTPPSNQDGNQIPQADPTVAQGPTNATESFQLVGVDEVKLSNIKLTFQNDELLSKQKFKLKTLIARAKKGQATSLEALGSLNTIPLTISATTVALVDLLKLNLPIKFQADAGVGELKLDIDGSLSNQGAELRAKIEGTNLAGLNEPLGLALPALQNYKISTTAQYTGTQLVINTLNLDFDDSIITGSATVDHGSSPIALSGQIDIESLNLDPFLESVDDSDSSESLSEETAPPSKPETEDLSSIVDQLASYAVDFDINMQRINAGGAILRNSSLQIDLKQGVLDTPLKINLNGIPLEGNLSVSGKDKVLSAVAYLEVQSTDIQDLEQWFMLDGIDGSLGKLRIDATTTGNSIAALTSAITTKLEINQAELSYGDNPAGENVSFSLDTLRANVAGNSPLIIDASGQLLEESFSLSLKGGKLKQLVRGKQWPIAIIASGAGANIDLTGFVRKPGESTGSELKLAISGPKLGDLHRWLGVDQNVEAAYSINATATTDNGNLKVDDLDIDLGNTSLDGVIAAINIENGNLFKIDITSELIDVSELSSFFPASDQGISESTTNEQAQSENITPAKNAGDIRESVRTALKIPILPGGINLPDANIDVALNELRAESMSVMDIGFAGSMRNGILDSSPFSMKFGGTEFSGSIAFDSISTPANAKLLLETKEIDIGSFLREIKATEDINARASLLQVQLDLKGYNLGRILSNSIVTAKVEEGQWILGEPGSKGELVMEIVKGDLVIAPGKPITLIQDVVIKGEPVAITMTSGNPSTRKETDDAYIQIDLQYLDNALTLAGYTPVPLQLSNLTLDLKFDGENLGSLSKLAGVRIPKVGPYNFVGKIDIKSKGYFVEKLKAEIGESVLNGTAKYRTDKDVPEFEILLVSDRLQLDDFKVRDQIRDKNLEVTAQQADSTEQAQVTDLETDSSEEEPRFTAQSLAMANGRFNLKVKEVVSGNDWLGEGEINITLQDSRIDFNPVQLKLPGGKFDASIELYPEEEMIHAGIKASIDQFNYGVLARRAKPESTMSGLISLDVKLDSQTKYLDKLLANADGYMDFLLIPKDFEAGIIDLWASSLLVAVLPKIGTDVSLINCVIAKFNIEDGLMKEQDIYLDTSKLRAKGKGEINFKEQTISYVLAPKAKNAGLFQAQPPITVDGKFSDLKIGLDGGLLGTALRMAATTYTVPIRIIMGDNVPRDGSDICIPLEKREQS